MLALEIELLTGAYRAALPDGSGAEWPPHVERVFSALVQAWGDGGCAPEERAALEWLENLPAPSIEASPSHDCSIRTAPTVFVPPNDPRGSDLAVLPDRRRRQARNFHVAVPANPIIRLIWQEAVMPASYEAALRALTTRVASLGHSASLVRLSFTQEGNEIEATWQPADDGETPLRVPYSGRLDHLEKWFARGERPQSGPFLRYRELGAPLPPDVPKSILGGADDWFVFEDMGGRRPDLLAFAQVAKCVRASLMAHGPQPAPEIISGHTPDGAATSAPHIAVVPLANIGWPRSTGDLLGFAVVLPRSLGRIERQPVLQALAKFARIDRGEGAYAELRLSSELVWRVERTSAPSRQSLQPGRWCRAAAEWASATPVLLDRFPDHDDPVEEARLIAAACRNIGLPEPIGIEIHKHPAVRGALSAYPARGNPSRPDWSFPASAKFGNRPRRHAILRFAEPVEGPVILGAGRFHGFGLCLPKTEERDA